MFQWNSELDLTELKQGLFTHHPQCNFYTGWNPTNYMKGWRYTHRRQERGTDWVGLEMSSFINKLVSALSTRAVGDTENPDQGFKYGETLTYLFKPQKTFSQILYFYCD